MSTRRFTQSFAKHSPPMLLAHFIGDARSERGFHFSPQDSPRLATIEAISWPSRESRSTCFSISIRAANSGPIFLFNSAIFLVSALGLLSVFLLNDLEELLTQILDLAIGLDLSLVATNDADEISRV